MIVSKSKICAAVISAALLMAGNTGDHKVKVRFDLSGLNYGKYKITDLLTGKAVFDPEIELTRNGYALWKIEKL